MIMLALLVASPAHAQASNSDDLSYEVAGAIHAQGFAAPYVQGRQESRSYIVPTLQVEGELTFRNTGYRARLGVGPAFIAVDIPPRIAFDAALMVLSYAERRQESVSRFGGLEVGAGSALGHARIYGGPVLGTAREFGGHFSSGKVGVRGSAGLAYEFGSRNDWATLSPGPALGVQVGIALTFAPTDY